MDKASATALALIESVVNELKLGTKHYDANVPGVVVTDVKDILLLMIEDRLLVEPVPERKYLFDKEI